MSDPFRSQRLIYRGLDPKTDLDLYLGLAYDWESEFANNPGVPLPTTLAAQEEHMKNMQTKSVLAVTVCLPATEDAKLSTTEWNDLRGPKLHEAVKRAAPIGMAVLMKKGMPTSRIGFFGISIARAYQNKGYGSEASQWTLDWAFRHANLHKVTLGYFEWNTGAGKLYEKLGFVKEGVCREDLWHEGRWWDSIDMGMLDREYWARQVRK